MNPEITVDSLNLSSLLRYIPYDTLTRYRDIRDKRVVSSTRSDDPATTALLDGTPASILDAVIGGRAVRGRDASYVFSIHRVYFNVMKSAYAQAMTSIPPQKYNTIYDNPRSSGLARSIDVFAIRRMPGFSRSTTFDEVLTYFTGATIEKGKIVHSEMNFAVDPLFLRPDIINFIRHTYAKDEVEDRNGSRVLRRYRCPDNANELDKFSIFELYPMYIYGGDHIELPMSEDVKQMHDALIEKRGYSGGTVDSGYLVVSISQIDYIMYRDFHARRPFDLFVCTGLLEDDVPRLDPKLFHPLLRYEGVEIDYTQSTVFDPLSYTQYAPRMSPRKITSPGLPVNVMGVKDDSMKKLDTKINEEGQERGLAAIIKQLGGPGRDPNAEAANIMANLRREPDTGINAKPLVESKVEPVLSATVAVPEARSAAASPVALDEGLKIAVKPQFVETPLRLSKNTDVDVPVASTAVVPTDVIGGTTAAVVADDKAATKVGGKFTTGLPPRMAPGSSLRQETSRIKVGAHSEVPKFQRGYSDSSVIATKGVYDYGVATKWADGSKTFARTFYKYVKIATQDRYCVEVGAGDGRKVDFFKSLNASTLLLIEPNSDSCDKLTAAVHKADFSPYIANVSFEECDRLSGSVCVFKDSFQHVMLKCDPVTVARERGVLEFLVFAPNGNFITDDKVCDEVKFDAIEAERMQVTVGNVSTLEGRVTSEYFLGRGCKLKSHAVNENQSFAYWHVLITQDGQ